MQFHSIQHVSLLHILLLLHCQCINSGLTWRRIVLIDQINWIWWLLLITKWFIFIKNQIDCFICLFIIILIISLWSGIILFVWIKARVIRQHILVHLLLAPLTIITWEAALIIHAHWALVHDLSKIFGTFVKSQISYYIVFLIVLYLSKNFNIRLAQFLVEFRLWPLLSEFFNIDNHTGIICFHNGLKFQLEWFLKAKLSIPKQSFELSIELLLHSLQIFDWKRKHCTIFNGLNSELPNKIEILSLKILKHLFDIHQVLTWSYEAIDLSKMVSIVDLNVNNILLKR